MCVWKRQTDSQKQKLRGGCNGERKEVRGGGRVEGGRKIERLGVKQGREEMVGVVGGIERGYEGRDGQVKG